LAKKIDEATERAKAALLGMSALLDPYRLKMWDESQLTVTQLRLLSLLEEKEGVGNAELANKLLVTRPSVSALLDRLEKGGFLRREISPEDRRGIKIWLEPAGRDAVTRVRGEAASFVKNLLGDISERDKLAFARSAEKVVGKGRSLREAAKG